MHALHLVGDVLRDARDPERHRQRERDDGHRQTAVRSPANRRAEYPSWKQVRSFGVWRTAQVAIAFGAPVAALRGNTLMGSRRRFKRCLVRVRLPVKQSLLRAGWSDHNFIEL
jgi:hypothetical protein